jgi:transcriptional regulator with GAF, ATPase, and Fis domain/tetratricopeptide (TPR) repeat protein
MGVSLIELALAVSERPLSADSLIEWGMARPSELISWLDAARARHIVAEDDSLGPGYLRTTGEARSQALANATTEDFRVLAKLPAFVPQLIATGRREASQRGTGMAIRLYTALFESVPPEAFPGGPGGFVDTVLESVRLYRGVSWQLGAILDHAIEIATERGDIAAQAVLLAACALSVEYGLFKGDGAEMLARAREAADAVGGHVRIEVLVYTAVHLVFSGRLREGIAAFEDLLGDVPMELLTDEGRLLIDPDAICALAAAYSEAGQHPRALGLLQQLRALGEQLENPAVVEEAKAFLGYVHAAREEYEAAGRYTEEAYAKYGAGEGDPNLGWFSAVALALVRTSEDKLAEARDVLEIGVSAWKRAGSPPIVLLGPYEVFERLEAAGERPFTEIDMVAEAERTVKMPLVQPAGLGHRFLAKRKSEETATDEELQSSATHFQKAMALLKEAGAVHDLARVCTEAADLAERRGLHDDARSLRQEASRVCHARTDREPRDDARLRSVLLDLGRLPTGERGDGFWGEISARLCKGLGCERCALIELTGEPRLLAARGGTRQWQEEIRDRAKEPLASPKIVESKEEARLVLVPFAAPDMNRRGLVALENVYTKPSIGNNDADLLDTLGVQLGVLFGNVTLWQELSQARTRLEQENRYFRENTPAAASGSQMVVHSPAMREVLQMINRVAPSNATVLITGETGAGKELVAHEVHRQSQRCAGPFIAVHVASLAPGLVASGLFGHERGAFTGATQQTKGRFELADGGTLFLDEVGELTLDDQVKLLRVLQEGTFERVGGARPLHSDFRLIAATNRDLEAEVRAGRFREDLYFRLNVFPLRVPPLRERREEIPTLALYFMERVTRQRGLSFEGIGEADMARLVDWDWPGNVRELEHVIERASLLSEPPRLRIPPLDTGTQLSQNSTVDNDTDDGNWMTLAEAERRYIAKVLRYTSGRVTGAGGAAEILDLKPSTLNFRIRKLGLTELLSKIRSQKTLRKTPTVENGS